MFFDKCVVWTFWLRFVFCFCAFVVLCLLSFGCQHRLIAFWHPRRRALKQEGVDIDGAEDEIVVDAAAGSQFFQVMQGTCPCITKSRGGQLGHYLMQAGRYVNIYEVAGLQGWKREWVDVLLEANNSVSELGKAFGDGMSLNVLQRILPRALYSVNLLQELPDDPWENIPSTGKLPSAVYD